MRWLSSKIVRKWIAPRPKNSHKGNFGHVLIVAGSRGMVGAGILSAHGALKAGAGLVTLAVPRNQQIIAAKHLRPEAMTLGLPETSEGTFSFAAVSLALAHIKKRRVTSLVIGPGLSKHSETRDFVKKLLQKLSPASTLKGVVLDADGFLALSGTSFLKKIKIPVIVTPHAGELSRFIGKKISSSPASRKAQAEKFAKLNQVICVLKGHQTLVTTGRTTWVNPTGNPGMARGGSGDILSGMIAALLMNVRLPEIALKAACAGVYIHGFAGDLAAKEKTQIAMSAGDIAEKIPTAFKKIKSDIYNKLSYGPVYLEAKK